MPDHDHVTDRQNDLVRDVTFASFTERPIYDALAEVGKALSNPLRLRLLDALQQDPRTVDELAEFAGLPVKNTSAQLQVLRSAHLVVAERRGTRVLYAIAPDAGALMGAVTSFGETRVLRVREAIDQHFSDHPWVNPVDVADLEALIADGTVTLVDVRSADEYERGHIDGAVSLPLPDLEARLLDLPHDGTVVAYCEGPYCLASPKAAEILVAAGYDCRTVRGGYTAWKRHHPS
jgi:rhodanese-related sulfurtransferase/DNA-binding transcriptional ArsR family regulator